MVSLEIHSEGQTQVLSISNYSETTSLSTSSAHVSNANEVARPNRSDVMVQAEAREAIAGEAVPANTITVELTGVGISLINKRLVEVVYTTLSNLKIQYSDNSVLQTCNIVCRWIQIDNQLHEAIYPVLLRPTALTRDGAALEGMPTLQASVTVLNGQCECFGK